MTLYLPLKWGGGERSEAGGGPSLRTDPHQIACGDRPPPFRGRKEFGDELEKMSVSAFIVPLSDRAATDPDRVGPKAANLAKLTHAGLPTPGPMRPLDSTV